MLEGLIYVSAPNPSLARADIEHILTSARRNNETQSVTGILLYSPQMFVQVLEGPADILDQTLETIKADGRHSDVTLLTRDTVDQRVFANWSMAFRDIEESDSDRLKSEIGWDTARKKLNTIPSTHSMALLVTSISEIVN